MKRLLLLLPFIAPFITHAQIGYTFSALSGTYSYNSGTSLLGSGVDENISASTSIGFTFQFGCANYTTFQASSNGVLYLGTAIASAPFDNFPDLAFNADRPVIAPLWDDLKTSSAAQGGGVNYTLSGASPNRILTVEWKKMKWYYASTGPIISFQVKLYETSNRIDFIYQQENIANLAFPAAAIGLAGANSGDYYSLNNASSSPTASQSTETDNISTAPATGQIYRWDPISCSGTPSGITSSASPASLCSAGTSTLSLSGASGCGLSYQWQSSTTGTGGWSNIAGATSSTQTVSVPAGGLYYQCIVTCSSSGLSGTSSSVHVTVGTPSNDNCSGATTITVGNCVAGDVNCASQSQAGCLGTANDDVWYKFVATSTTQNISLSASSSFDPVVQVFSGACGSLTSVWCDDATYTYGGSSECRSASGLTIGNTYYVRVYDYYSGYPSTTTFTLCVSAMSSYTCNLNYSYSTITNSQDAGVTNAVTISDDHLSSAVPLGFNFCFDGYQYTQAYISSNASLVFDAVDPCVPNVDQSRIAAYSGAPTGYTIAGPAPSTTDYVPQNAILAPWHDIDPGNGGAITYATLGTSPNRRFVLYFNGVKQFYTTSPCQNTAYDYTAQIKLYETSNNIEIHVQQMNSCAAWNNGQAILGLHNAFGTLAVVPTGYNAKATSPYNVYSISNTAWKFVPNCTGCAILLPVEIAAFTASRKDDLANEISWTTASETAIRWFHVQRSTDGVNFGDVNTQQARSSTGAQYDYTDVLDDASQTYYYRIATENLDGTIEYSGIRVVQRDKSSSTVVLNLYPNPFTNDINIDMESMGESLVTVEVFGMFGRLVYQQEMLLSDGANTVRINDFEKQKGLYLVRITNKLGQVLLTRKMIRQ